MFIVFIPVPIVNIPLSTLSYSHPFIAIISVILFICVPYSWFPTVLLEWIGMSVPFSK